MTPTRRAAVLGHPVAHSLSPVLHTAAYRALGLDGWEYTAIDTTIEDLPALVGELDLGWAGLSVTMPLKQAIIPLVDHVEPLAQAVGAVNTVLVGPARCGVTLTGTNTDVYGLVEALREGLGSRDARIENAVVLGGGATAASTLAALAELGCTSPRVLVRSLSRTGGLQEAAARMGVVPRYEVLEAVAAVGALRRADVVVSTMPAHAADPVAHAFATHGGAPQGVLLDVVYDPRPTALSQAWASAGGTVVGGERMLLHQAVEQVRLMTGRTAPLAAMDAALAQALATHPAAR
ncbi:shikimate dehydrogenase [Isoptericola variabilis]|uniref:Shikimate dehydrogenase substrate binding domain protein n=1 Tax=Isoptericola variabilis (strain 225) TaxID=743718 RepID=F6FVF0_ISOV2|nr:shikimate dehydrogenase [Isoptericola variabilis]AEG44377.1 Shikimate dehydrogenase substrate binding domain protein [Isoptericola variabilis 225]TWH34370.1 shikimate dehydrogenase [Isoptericola variabilis J7]